MAAPTEGVGCARSCVYRGPTRCAPPLRSTPQVIPLKSYSQTGWTLSPPARQELLDRLRDTSRPVYIEIMTSLRRSKGTGVSVCSARVVAPSGALFPR